MSNGRNAISVNRTKKTGMFGGTVFESASWRSAWCDPIARSHGSSDGNFVEAVLGRRTKMTDRIVPKMVYGEFASLAREDFFSLEDCECLGKRSVCGNGEERI